MLKYMFAVMAMITIAPPTLADLSDERQILNTINNVGYFADQQNWDKVAEQFHPNGTILDYTNDPAKADTLKKISPADVVEGWKQILPGFDRTHHVMGTHSVHINGRQATTTSNVYATHILENEGEDVWVFIGDYDHQLEKTRDGWKIVLMRAHFRAQTGNENLPKMAMEKVAKSQR